MLSSRVAAGARDVRRGGHGARAILRDVRRAALDVECKNVPLETHSALTINELSERQLVILRLISQERTKLNVAQFLG